MSAEATPRDLEAERSRTATSRVLAEVDTVLDGVLAELGDVLGEAVATGSGLGEHDPGPLGIDLVGELGTRVRHHGKRLRPVLAHWGWAASGGGHASRAHLVDVAAALELLHLFALIQDDVMDRSAARRGRPTLHVTSASRHREAGALGDPELFGDSVAVLVSDLALSEATLLACRSGGSVARAWRLMAAELVEGQLLDVTHTAGRRRDLPTSQRIARFKSGRYTITRPLQLGALVAGAAPEQVEGLVGWGDLVGDAFAVRDDVLGVWGDPALTGKPAGDDLRSGKPTALIVWAAEMLAGPERPLLTACDAGELDDHGVRRLQRAMEAAGVRDRAEQAIEDLVGRAHATLDALDVDDDCREAMRDLTETVAWRTR